ncbi:class I SAM-dependent methyltransferase [Streptomyces salinarius]|uniref:class I SAM-dependent methyltransferase n=1 Tax=Streptomyces salinarius TaxID=2762598 RepID=UPI0028526B08|nr:class I SAM-dependent methyltransferase [Streptomyces salinarius]
MYGTEFAEIYDLVYAARGKDYAGECAEVVRHVRARRPDAASLLDVACGTGAHLALLRDEFAVVEGLELSEHMIARARAGLPDVPVHQGDMRGFRTGRAYDALTCMFSSIGYVGSPEDLGRALSSMARHLTPGGVLVLEPWYFPEAFLPEYIADDLVRTGDRVVARVSYSAREGDRVPILVHYVDALKGRGIRHFTDVHRMSLFTREQYRTAFERAGCSVEYVEGGPFRCGLFVGVREDGPPA